MEKTIVTPQFTPQMKDSPGRAHNRVRRMAINQTIRGKGDIATLGRAIGVCGRGNTGGGGLGRLPGEGSFT